MKTNQAKKILKEIEEMQPELRSKFWTTILEILREDSTQSCNDAKGTKIVINQNSIVINDGISPATIKKLMGTGYLIGATEEGRIEIHQMILTN